VGDHLTETVTRLVLQLAVILFAAKLGAEVCERYLKIPAVLGELAVGIVIGPYALGGLAFLGVGPLFPLVSAGEAASVARFPRSSTP